jgi:hypothetical protein
MGGSNRDRCPGANTEAVFNTDNQILTLRVPQPKTTRLDSSILCRIVFLDAQDYLFIDQEEL